MSNQGLHLGDVGEVANANSWSFCPSGGRSDCQATQRQERP